jgi:putative intracellular protease/amidase/uncharacterized protein (DUF952 family)
MPTRARWLYHLSGEREPPAPGAEGFVHCSFAPDLAETARLHFGGARDLLVHRIDPRRAPRIRIEATPRGPMPHLYGAVARDAVADSKPFAEWAGGPDALTGTRFGCLAYRGMTLLDLVSIYDPVSRIAAMGIDPSSTCEIVSAHPEGPAWAAHGAELSAARARPDLAAFDVLVVPGGHGSRELERDERFLEWLRTFPANRLAVSVCTGALLLGAAGRLAGRRATTHASSIDRLAGYGATAVRERVVDEGELVTGGGVTSGLDVGLHLVAELCGDEARERVARQMEIR